MLETLDLTRTLDKAAYNQAKGELEAELVSQQRRILDLGIPVAILFEGWDAAGKGTLINKLILPLDPRGFVVRSAHAPNEEERLRPFLWRFWIHTPARGRFTIFDRGWYRRVLVDRVEGGLSMADVRDAYRDIAAFERQLADDGAVTIKFFLHIAKDEQRRRLDKLAANESTAWRVTKDDRRRHKLYDRYVEAVEDMLTGTGTDSAPWTLVAAHDRRHATIEIFRTVTQRLKRAIEEAVAGKPGAAPVVAARTPPPPRPRLKSIDLSREVDLETYRRKLKTLGKTLRDLEHGIYVRRIPVIIVYEGWDAAGKGGTIRRLTRTLDPRGYDVIPIAAPDAREKAHHYLWRFWTQMPKAGHVAIFDRSWYGRVMVERVEGFCGEEEWRRAFREINEIERHLTSFGAVVVKFWLQIDRREQLKRFRARERDPSKHWKITDEDWRNRRKWPQYERAVEEMLARTGTSNAPWTIVESNCKRHARIKTMETVIRAIRRAL